MHKENHIKERHTELYKGYIYGILAVSIWAGWAIVSKMGINSNLTPFDITFLRYCSASIFLLPVFIKKSGKIFAQNKINLAFILLGAGAPYMFITASGFSFSPSAHSVLIPCHMPVFYALVAYVLSHEVPSKIRSYGLALIIIGGLLKLSTSLNNPEYLKGDLLFILAAFVWAVFTYNLKQTSLSPMAATAFISVASAIIMLIPYGVYQYIKPHELHLGSLVFQLFYQGVATSIISMLFYNKAIQIIGAARTTSLTALVPLLTTIFSYIVFGEIPALSDYIFVTLATIGVVLCSGVIRKKATLV